MLQDYVLPAVTGIMPPAALRTDLEALRRYVGLRHDESDHEMAVVLEDNRLVVQPSFWWRIFLDRIGPNTFSGYWEQLGSLRVRLLPGDADEANRFLVRFLLGQRVYRRIK